MKNHRTKEPRLQHHKQPQHDTVPSDNTNTYTSWTPPN